MNCFLILICKVYKSNELLFDKNTYFVVDWTKIILNFLFIVDWNLLRKIIFDRNSKFVFDFWKSVLKILKIKLLIITMYYVQTNEQNERINQTIEIVIRFLLTKNSNIDWMNVLFNMQFDFNNVFNVIIDQTFNQFKYEFSSRDLTSLIFINQSIVKKNNRFNSC